MIKYILAAIAFICLPNNAFSQSETIVADRPGFSTGTYTVGKGHINIESGYQYTFTKISTNQNMQNVPLLNIRIGLTENLELNTLWSGLNIVDKDDHTSVSDISIGSKYSIYSGRNYNFSAIGFLTLPTGTEPSTSDQVDYFAGLLADYNLPGNNTLFGVVQSSSFAFRNNRKYDLQMALGSSFSHSAKLGTFIEFYSIIPGVELLENQVAMDGGMTYLLTPNLQIDVNAALGLKESTNNFVGFGIAWRY